MNESLETCNVPAISRPFHLMPSGACDTHTHVFGPLERFAPVHPSTYAIPDASAEAHDSARNRLGLTHSVIVQPGPYGSDPSAMFDALDRGRGTLRGVAVADPSIDPDTLKRWAARGVCALRFVEVRGPAGTPNPGSVGFDGLRKLAPAMQAAGLHAQLWGSTEQICEVLPSALQFGFSIVLDHMAMIDTASGVGAQRFRQLLAHLANPLLWIKLVICRIGGVGPDSERVRPFHDAIVATAPERCLWGSDWPYVRMTPAPDAAAVLDQFCDWVDDPALRQAILVENPRRLFGF